ncbi:MAG: hypothetical protein FWD01_05195 [Defluviitaleaceae bacterium]|nr:hypothetical protein [Defluviitaleaceae bacterium]
MGESIGITEVLDLLEKPENEEYIQYLAHFKNLKHAEGLKEAKGLTGMISRFALRFTSKRMDSLKILAECKTTADIKAFNKSEHYKKVKHVVKLDGWEGMESMKKLEKLSRLEELEELKKDNLI